MRMAGLLLLFLGLLLVFGGLIAATWGIVGLALHLLFAGVIGWVADAIVPGDMPFGWVGAITAGLVGSWLGRILLGNFGPALFGFHLLPALVGAVILAFVATALFGRTSRERI
jgi:uncharacterized membrane protein YeaQ/YmgE (transglycosylase-associated protein family)